MNLIFKILRLLLSIQSLLNENPIINEPGFEKETGSKAKNYADVVNYFNIKTSTIKMIENPPHGFDVFKDVMTNHFIKNIDYYRNYIEQNKQLQGTNISSHIYSMNTIIDIEYLKTRIDDLYSTYNNATGASNVDIVNIPKKKGVRKAPNDLAKIYDIGYTMISENDGKMYKVVEVSGPKRTMKRWIINK